MFTKDHIEIDVLFVEYDGDAAEMIVEIATPVGVLQAAGRVTRIGKLLRVDGAHIQGAKPGALNRKGLNAIAAKLLELADVEEVVIQGGIRTTGCNKGRAPRPFRFPNN